MTRSAGRELTPLPSPRRSPETELAWASGLFDGEGSLSLSGPADKSRRFVNMEIPQASSSGIPETLLRFHDVIRGGAIGGPYPPGSKWSRLPRYRWQAGGRHQVSSVLALLWPYLATVKRDQALRLLPHLDDDFLARVDQAGRAAI
jgi:hypothetical protein